jgi:hypothetical protein
MRACSANDDNLMIIIVPDPAFTSNRNGQAIQRRRTRLVDPSGRRAEKRSAFGRQTRLPVWARRLTLTAWDQNCCWETTAGRGNIDPKYNCRDAIAFGTRPIPPRQAGEAGHSIEIPRKTLILLPDVYPHALRWGLAKVGDKDGMQLTGHLQATNTSKYGIRASGIRLIEPTGVEIFTQIVSIGDPETGIYDPKYLIPARSIGELNFMFIVIAVTSKPGTTLTVTIAVLDQFGNEHVVRDLQLRFIGPRPSAAFDHTSAPASP